VAVAFALADQDQRFGPVVGGLVIGLSIGAMHNIGMGGMELAGQVLRDPTCSTISVGIGAAFAMLALFNEREDASARRRALSVLLLVLAVGGLHFTAMSGTTIVPSVLSGPSEAPNGNLPLAIAVAAVTGLILVLGAAASILDKRRDIEVDRQRALASVAFEGILIHRHGVVLDANDAFCRMVGGSVGVHRPAVRDHDPDHRRAPMPGGDPQPRDRAGGRPGPGDGDPRPDRTPPGGGAGAPHGAA
jgi:PAS domain-containing protein